MILPLHEHVVSKKNMIHTMNYYLQKYTNRNYVTFRSRAITFSI